MDATFKRIYVINLKRRPDRLADFFARLDRCGWPFSRPEVYEAIEGDRVGVPPDFTQGGGAFGCRQSHVRILEDCLMRGDENVLVFEDDADLRPGFGEEVLKFLSEVPQDWEGLMLGGQHHRPSSPVKPGVVKVNYAQRTHCYAARGRYMQGLVRRWAMAPVHIDWMMKDWQHAFNVYGPERWIVGQAGGRSDIAGRVKPPEWWNPAKGDEPVVLLHVPRTVVEELRQRGFHGGYERNPDGIDNGLLSCLAPGSSESEKIGRLSRWISMLQQECNDVGAVCMVWHPEATLPVVQAATKGKVAEVTAETAIEVIEKLPQEFWPKSGAHRRAVIVLRVPKQLLPMLRDNGIHTGNWRDEETDIDNGLLRIFGKPGEFPTSGEPSGCLISQLRSWCSTLFTEAYYMGLSGRVCYVAAWHPAATVETLQKATDLPVVELKADDLQTALARLVEIQQVKR